MNAIFYRKSTKNLHESQCTHFLKIFSPQMLLKVWNSESPWKTTQKKCFQNRILTPGRSSNSSLKALSAFIVASRTCEIFGPFRVRACVSCLTSRFRPFGVVRTKNASRDKRKKCWRKFFFVGEAPPSMLWNVPGTVLTACRQLPGVHAYIFFLPIFRFQRTSGFSCPFFGLREHRRERWNSSPVSARTESGHVISCHVTHREWSVSNTRQAESGLAMRARSSGMVDWNFRAFQVKVKKMPFRFEFNVLEFEWLRSNLFPNLRMVEKRKI